MGAETLARLERVTLDLYARAADDCARAGLILADTKFELGLDADGALVLGDEAVTPDSSRLWPADRWSPGQSPPSFDKQYLRDWLDADRLGPRLAAAGAAGRGRGGHPAPLRRGPRPHRGGDRG